jgi:hypothetical protein
MSEKKWLWALFLEALPFSGPLIGPNHDGMYPSWALGDPKQGGFGLTASTHQFEFTSNLRAMHAKERPHFFRDENSFTYR